MPQFAGFPSRDSSKRLPAASQGWNERAWLYPRTNRRVPHIPDFLWGFVGSLKFMRLSSVRFCGDRSRLEGEACGIPHLAKNQRDTPNFLYAALDRTACAPFCPRFASAYPGRKRWAKPSTAFRSGPYPLSSRPERSAVERPAFPFP
jgi:hypothetical protein